MVTSVFPVRVRKVGERRVHEIMGAERDNTRYEVRTYGKSGWNYCMFRLGGVFENCERLDVPLAIQRIPAAPK